MLGDPWEVINGIRLSPPQKEGFSEFMVKKYAPSRKPKKYVKLGHPVTHTIVDREVWRTAKQILREGSYTHIHIVSMIEVIVR